MSKLSMKYLKDVRSIFHDAIIKDERITFKDYLNSIQPEHDNLTHTSTLKPKDLLRNLVILESHKWDDDNSLPAESLRAEIKKRNPYLPKGVVDKICNAPDVRGGREIKGMPSSL
jgi:hypothetical protein